MAEEGRTDTVEKLLTEQRSLEERKQALINDLLQQKEAAIKAFDEKLATLGCHATSGKRRSHHKKLAVPVAEAAVKPAPKAKA